LFILLSSLVFWANNLNGGSAYFNSNLDFMGGFLLLFIVPIMTMRILAEDRKNGTEVLLITSPTSITGIVVGKYLATVIVFLTMTCITFIYPIVLLILGGKPFMPQMIGGYVGFILLGASLLAVGVFSSSLTENQVISAVVSFVSILILSLAKYISGYVGGFIAKILDWLSVFARYEDFNRGVLNLAPIVYYVSFIAVFLFLTVRVIERRRWSQG
jgi:ABC-2 type transport system permease protein